MVFYCVTRSLASVTAFIDKLIVFQDAYFNNLTYKASIGRMIILDELERA
jgi:hypothetical protein